MHGYCKASGGASMRDQIKGAFICYDNKGGWLLSHFGETVAFEYWGSSRLVMGTTYHEEGESKNID